jgi:hypothetical protein
VSKCRESSEITAYLQGEGTEEERGMLRRHFEQCEACARELAQFERAFGALGKIETVEPSPDFQSRVEQAFLKAHPKFAPKPKFRLVRAASIAAAVLILAAGAMVLLTMSAKSGKDEILATMPPTPIPEEDFQYRTFPKTALPSRIDASAWGEALAYDQRLMAAAQTAKPADKALSWLAARQEPDGSWQGSDAGETIELTGLALLALSHSEEHGLAIRKGVAFLRSRQRDSGAIGGGTPESHAIATLAMQEVAIRTKDPAAIRVASKGIDLIAQQNASGPWGRGVVAGWHYHVLRLAVASGDRALTGALVAGHEGLSQRKIKEEPNDADWAASIRAELWTDPKPDLKRWAADVSRLLVRSPIPGTEPANFSKNDLRLAYFGTALLAPLGGDAWTKWWGPLQAKLAKTQAADGSWPAEFQSGKGQVYTTALCALILQTRDRVPAYEE